MERVSISELKDQLSAYLKKVKEGQTVVVTDRNKPVAQLTPIPNSESESERMERLVAMGVLIPPKNPPLSIEDIRRMCPVSPGARLLEALLEERESNW